MSAEQPSSPNPFAEDVIAAFSSKTAPSQNLDLSNPYAAPENTPVDGVDETCAWRDDRSLVIHREVKLPEVCVKCGTETRERFPYRLSITPITSWEFRPFTFVVGFCSPCRSRHRLWKVAKALAGLALVGYFVMWGYNTSIDLAFDPPDGGPRLVTSQEMWQFFTLFGVVLLIHFIADSRTLSLDRTKYIAPKVWLSGANRDFLEQLPPLPQQTAASTPFDSAGS